MKRELCSFSCDYMKKELYILCCGQKYKQTDKAPPESGKVLKKFNTEENQYRVYIHSVHV